jgi:hypothetical protein
MMETICVGANAGDADSTAMAAAKNTIDKRRRRVADAIALREPDRIPFAPKMGMAYCLAGGIDAYEAMMDLRNLKDGVRKFLSRYEVDLFRPPAIYPSDVLEILGTGYINWPGATKGLALDSGHQIVDQSFLGEDEYDDFLRDPSHFILTKIFPRMHKNLAGLSKLTFNNVWEFGQYFALQAFSDPEVRQTLITLMAAGDRAKAWAQARSELFQVAEEMQAPPSNTGAQSAPYDMFADNIRGYLNVPMDIFTIPDKVAAAIDLMEYYAVKSVEALAARGVDSCWIPLHGGTDDFMSNDTYRTYYWPSLRRTIELLVDKDITPFVFCEGKYDTRLEILREVPKGKVVYMFEKVDIANAKKILGDVACISGNIPGASLQHGDRDTIIKETKKLIDICAPGGGFIMDCSISLDSYDETLMDAWYETTLEYGR